MDTPPPLPLGEELASGAPQNALLDLLFPGFSIFSAAVNKYLHIDLNLYIPLVLLLSGLTLAWRYFSEYFSGLVESHLMSVVDIRPDDEIYNMLMAWVANQGFSQGARRFVVNTNLNSRSWYLWRWSHDDDDDDGDEGGLLLKKKKALAYTPTFGSHWFIYKGRLLIFRRTQNSQQAAYLTVSEREEISISCFGRNPWILKELLHEAREEYMKRDEAKTLIYRGTTKSGSTEPTWQRCLARSSRPLSTVVLNEKVKAELIDDVRDYLNPATRRWYANRGIPYRRGYLLYGPPGTGKSSLSLALAGFFKMRIYIVSLSSVTANEENLASLFAELPRRCVVLLEDIDTAGLTHTREDGSQAGNVNDDADNSSDTTNNRRRPGAPKNVNNTNNNNTTGRLSLSGLLNILDGVASQEGRVLIMTTNHLEKLDKALIRPGRVDMIVKFDRADTQMTAAIFRAIYAPLEGDEMPSSGAASSPSSSTSTSRALFQLESALHKTGAGPKPTPEEEENQKKREAEAAEAARKKEETIARVDELAAQFAAKIPAHEFSPAEIQGFLLKNKRNPERAVEGAEQWVVERRKEKKEKELEEAREKREREEREKKEREEEEKKEEEAERKASKKQKKKEAKREREAKRRKAKKSSSKRSKKKDGSSGSEEESASESSSDDEAESGSESEREREKTTAAKPRSKPAATPAAPADPTTAASPPAPAAVDTTAAPADAPAELNQTPADDVRVKAEPVVVVAPTMTVDTDKAKEATNLEVQRTPQGADSGYGTP